MAKSTFFKDFKDFITKGNIVDMAVGVVVGNAFKAIATSLVNDIIMPPLSYYILGDVNFTDLKVVLQPEVLDEAGEVLTKAITLNYGNFIQLVIDFLLTALCIFLVLRGIVKAKALAEKLKKKEEEEAAAAAAAAPAEPSEEILLLRDIRDALNKDKTNE